MRRLSALACLVVALAAACGGGDGEGAPTEAGTDTTAATTTGATTETAGPRIVIATDGGEVAVDVEIADSPDEQQVGLMHRESLPEDAGMIFVFPDDRQGGFWMKNTLIPLSIAFADSQGTIVSILDMEPCEADPCEIYDPGVTYRTALEVNQGAFERWGVEEGDRLRLEER